MACLLLCSTAVFAWAVSCAPLVNPHSTTCYEQGAWITSQSHKCQERDFAVAQWTTARPR
ncbi:hypothetical protein BaRGS_00039420, partial [Batillaria attramentaria]